MRNLDALSGDARAACEKMLQAPTIASGPWRVTNPFESLYQCVYQLTMRTVL